MDTSETYIKMSELLPSELKREIFERDLVKHLVEGIVIDHRGNYWSVKGNSIGWAATQLLKQDQLQILSNLSWKDFDVECQKYDRVTKEQAGICVVMEHKFKKKWKNNEWKIEPTKNEG